MQTIRIQTTQHIELEYELAGVGDRLVAYLIDCLIYFAYGFVLSLVIDAVGGIGSRGWNIFFMALPILLYQLLCEVFLNGQSLGKKVRNIRVISLDGGQPHLGQFVTRWLFRIVDDMLTSGVVAVVTISVSEKAQRLGDMIAGTTVVRTTRRTAMQDTLFMETDHDHTPSFPRASELSDQDIALLKEVINRCEADPLNTGTILYKAYDKTRALLGVKQDYAPLEFLRKVVMDYNVITSREE
jgi:uncharacterized RDD family membrane protein YckC